MITKQDTSIPAYSLCARMHSYYHFQPEGRPRKQVSGFFSISKGGGQGKEAVLVKELSNIGVPKKTWELMCHREVTQSTWMFEGRDSCLVRDGQHLEKGAGETRRALSAFKVLYPKQTSFISEWYRGSAWIPDTWVEKLLRSQPVALVCSYSYWPKFALRHSSAAATSSWEPVCELCQDADAHLHSCPPTLQISCSWGRRTAPTVVTGLVISSSPRALQHF